MCNFYTRLMLLPDLKEMVAFTLALDGNYSPDTDEKIPYNNIITNIGNGYITKRDEFVCSQACFYVFFVSVLATSDLPFWLDFYNDTEKIGTAYSKHSPDSSSSNMFLLELQEADTVSARAANGCTMYVSNNYNTISGFKINYL